MDTQTPVPVVVPKQVSLALSSSDQLHLETSKTAFTVRSNTSLFRFDLAQGLLVEWQVNGRALLGAAGGSSSCSPGAAPLTLGFWRAPTDNDAGRQSKTWRQYGLDALTSQLRAFHVSENTDSSVSVSLTAQTYISPPILAWGFDVTTTYSISAVDNSLTISVHLVPHNLDSAPKTLPRVGLDVSLAPYLTRARWYGLGPGESYLDKKAAQRVGLWDMPADELATVYEVPQENGNRCETRWVQILDAQGCLGLEATYRPREKERQGDEEMKCFQWAAQKYDPTVLEQAKHPCDLEGMERQGLLWRLDCDSAGVGTGACGPGVKEDCQVAYRERWFEFRLRPVTRDVQR